MSSFYTSRTKDKTDTSSDETYDTINLYLNSQQGAIALPGYPNINAGYTAVLANPIILDISHRYVCALIKTSFDITNYTDKFYSYSIYCDLLEYQYEANNKTQLLYQVYASRYIPAGDQNNQADLYVSVDNVVWKFINPTQKIINRISFWVTDAATGLPLDTPAGFSYPTQFSILIKKVNSHVVAVSAI